MKGHAEIREMIDEFWRMPVGRERIAVAEAAIRHADALDDPDLSFAARLAATDAYSGPTRSYLRDADHRMLVAFSWCVAEYDRDPSRRSAWEVYALRWFFKNAVVVMRDNPAVPLDRIRSVLDRMKALYQANGQSRHAVDQYRWELELQVGNRAEQDRLYDAWVSAARDENSVCDHWDLILQMTHLTNRGREEEAAELAIPALSGEPSCTRPCHLLGAGLLFLARAEVLTEAMEPFLRTGRLSEAAYAHHLAYRRMRRAHEKRQIAESDRMGEIALHIRFCAITGNESRGLDIAETYLDALEQMPKPEDEMLFSAAAAQVLRRAAERGRTTVRTGGRTAEAAEMGEHLAERATAIAVRFDARNGTSTQCDRVASWLTAEPLTDRLPIFPPITDQALPQTTSHDGSPGSI